MLCNAMYSTPVLYVILKDVLQYTSSAIIYTKCHTLHISDSAFPHGNELQNARQSASGIESVREKWIRSIQNFLLYRIMQNLVSNNGSHADISITAS